MQVLTGASNPHACPVPCTGHSSGKAFRCYRRCAHRQPKMVLPSPQYCPETLSVLREKPVKAGVSKNSTLANLCQLQQREADE